MQLIKRYILIGIIFVLMIGTLSHFVYNLTGNNDFIGFFFPVNESTWEHMKLIYFAMILYALFAIPKLKSEYPCITSALLCSILIGTFAIPIIFYTYTGILGQNYPALDIATFAVSVLLAFHSAYKLTVSCKADTQKRFLLFIVLLLGICFVIFTYHPPNLGLFSEP